MTSSKRSTARRSIAPAAVTNNVAAKDRPEKSPVSGDLEARMKGVLDRLTKAKPSGAALAKEYVRAAKKSHGVQPQITAGRAGVIPVRVIGALPAGTILDPKNSGVDGPRVSLTLDVIAPHGTVSLPSWELVIDASKRSAQVRLVASPDVLEVAPAATPLTRWHIAPSLRKESK